MLILLRATKHAPHKNKILFIYFSKKKIFLKTHSPSSRRVQENLIFFIWSLPMIDRLTLSFMLEFPNNISLTLYYVILTRNSTRNLEFGIGKNISRLHFFVFFCFRHAKDVRIIILLLDQSQIPFTNEKLKFTSKEFIYKVHFVLNFKFMVILLYYPCHGQQNKWIS